MLNLVMIAEEHQFIINKTGFEYKVLIKELRINIMLLNEPGSYSELHHTLATTLQILAITHLKNYPGNNSQLLLMQYFQEKGWTVYNISEK